MSPSFMEAGVYTLVYARPRRRLRMLTDEQDRAPVIVLRAIVATRYK